MESDRAEVHYRNRHATTDLRLQLHATLGGSDGTILDLSGTSLRIDDTEFAAVEPSECGSGHTHPWKAEVTLNEGALTLPMQAPGSHGTTPKARPVPFPITRRAQRDRPVGLSRL